MSKKIKNKGVIVFLLGLLSAIGPFSIDMYLPGFEYIASDLNTTIDKVQLSLTSFFVGIAVGQMIYGPLLDRFGRRIPLMTGLFIYIAASIVLAYIQSVESLIFYRFVQALGSCSGMVAARAFVRDYFPPQETAKIFSMLMLVIGVSPVLAPTFGGYVTHYFGWNAIFIALALLIFLVLVGVFFFLPEKRGADITMSLRPRAIISNFLRVGKVPQFYIYASAGAFSASGLYAYLSGSPFVMMELYGVNERQYGWIFGLIAAGMVIASQVNNVVLNRFSSERVARIAASIQALVGLTMITLSLFDWMTLPILIALIFSYMSCQGFVFPNASALSLNPFAKSAGSASALLGFIQMTIGAFASFLTSFLHNHTEKPMIVVMAVCTCVSCFLIMFLGRKIKTTAG